MKFKPSKVYQVVWTYLFLGQQVLFPVAYAAEQLVKPTSGQPEVIRYQVAKGDTLGSVSRQFGVAPHQLLVLNHHLTPEAPYLVVGDTINVPRPQSLPTLAGENPLHLKEDTANAINVEQKVAQHAARLGQAFSVPDEVGTLVGAENESEIVKGARRAQRNSIAATGGQESTSAPSYGAKQETQYWRQQLATQFEEEANAYATSLLGGMGTARTRMTLDDQFSLASAEADVLLPLVEDKQSMLFTQFGLRRNEQERTIANLGVGQRHFLDRWMLGYNLFADYDLTNQHWRAGLGVEAWRDYLKLGANFYTPLSGWRDSSLFEGMEERAARGMDVRLEAYLPSYPQWSASLTAEQYLGDRVDLLGSEQLERDPHAITAGLHYNPFPLLKMDVEQVEASGGQSDTRFTLGVEWTLGATLSDMLNPSRVDKSLAGMRHDLVERNNDMVLEYRDKVALKASLNDLYSAPEGQSLTLTLNVQHSHQIASIQWFGPILEQSGLTPADTAGQDKLSLTLPTLPAYRADQSNEYRVVAMVTDINGQEASAEGVVVVTEDGALQPSIQLAERFVQLRAGERYQIDWGVVDPRQKPGKARSSAVSESIEGDVEADRDGYQYHYRLTFQGPEQVLKGRELVAPGQPNPGTRYRLDVEVTFPSGHVARDSMEFEFIGDTEVTDPAAKPQVSNLRMAGKLEVGQSLTATYAFNANGGDTTDSSTYVWGNQGETTAAAPAGQAVANSGVVPGHTLVAADVGEVKEVSVQAKNGLDVTGNTVTVDAQGKAADSNGGTGGGGNDTTGGTDTDGDGKGDTVIDPSNIVVRIDYASSATELINGVNGTRPVVAKDQMTAQCQIAGETDFRECDTRFNLQWFVDGQAIPGATATKFTASPEHQSKQVEVEAKLK